MTGHISVKTIGAGMAVLLLTVESVCGCALSDTQAVKKETAAKTATEIVPDAEAGTDVKTETEAKMEMDVKTEKKIYYIHDPGALFLKSPYNPKKQPVLTKELCEAAVDEAVENGSDVFISEIYGMVPWYPSEIYSAEEHTEWFSETFEKSGESPFSRYVKNGGDFLQDMCDETHRKGAEYWLSYRLNDHHGISFEVTNANANNWLVSKFYMDHLDERIGVPQSNCSWFQYMLDFRYDNVREYKLSIIAELIRNYDIDGLMIDFLRTPALFRLDATTSEQRREIVLDFLKAVRGMLDEKSRETGREYTFGVKIPLDMDAYDKLGIDVEAFEQEAGVRVFFLFDYYNTRQEYETLDFVRQHTKNSLVNYEVSNCTTWSSQTGVPRALRGTTKEQFYTTAYLAYQHGADGISLFNFAWYRNQDEFVVAYEPPFEAIRNLRDPDFLAAQPQHYYEAATENKLIHDFDLAAVCWNPGDRYSFAMEMSAPTEGWTENGILRLESLKAIADLDFEVQMNETVLEAASADGEPYENPYKNMLGNASKWLVYSVPKECLKEGANTVTVTNNSDQPVALYYIDLSIR